jgi:hypothetical protein
MFVFHDNLALHVKSPTIPYYLSIPDKFHSSFEEEYLGIGLNTIYINRSS